MLPCVCSVIDHRWRQNVVRTKKWHTRRSRVCPLCLFLSLCLFFFSKSFNIARKPSFCPAFAPPLHEKKPFDVIYLFKMKQFHWLLCVAKNCDWSRKIAPLSNLTRAPLLVEWKLTAKAELNCEIYKSWRKCWKNQVSFCHRSSYI